MSMNIQTLLTDDGSLQQADGTTLSRAAAHCRQLARQATSPQEREFYADRAYQLALRAISA